MTSLARLVAPNRLLGRCQSLWAKPKVKGNEKPSSPRSIPMDNELAFAPATEIRRLIASGEVSRLNLPSCSTNASTR